MAKVRASRWTDYFMYRPIDDESIEMAHTIYGIGRESLRRIARDNRLSCLDDLMVYIERNGGEIGKNASITRRADDGIDEPTDLEKAEKEVREKPIDELLADETPLEYFRSNTESTKTKSTTDKVNDCITALINHFSGFNRFYVRILSYEVRLYDDSGSDSAELVDDPQINCDAMLQVILGISSMADLANERKALTVFTIKNGKVFWAGTVRTENDDVIAFSDENLDIIFENEDTSEDLLPPR